MYCSSSIRGPFMRFFWASFVTCRQPVQAVEWVFQSAARDPTPRNGGAPRSAVHFRCRFNFFFASVLFFSYFAESFTGESDLGSLGVFFLCFRFWSSCWVRRKVFIADRFGVRGGFSWTDGKIKLQGPSQGRRGLFYVKLRTSYSIIGWI